MFRWAPRWKCACAWLWSKVKSPGRSCADGIAIDLPRRTCPHPSSGAAPVHAFSSRCSFCCIGAMKVLTRWSPVFRSTICSIEAYPPGVWQGSGHAPAGTRRIFSCDNGSSLLSVVHAGTGGRSSSSGRAPTAPNDTIFLNFFERRNSTTATTATTARGSSSTSSYRRAKVRKRHCRPPREPFAPHARALCARSLPLCCGRVRVKSAFDGIRHLPLSWIPQNPASRACGRRIK